MPELPEVETVVRDLNAAGLPGCSIVGCVIPTPNIIAQPTAQAFRKQVVGAELKTAQRRGKYILLPLLDGRWLIVHLRMAGRLLLGSCEREDRHDHVSMLLSDGRFLRYRDPRKFGRIWLCADPEEIVGKLGPEPLEIRSPAFKKLLRGRRSRIKALLLDQHVLAGLGNIYVDEALWRARIHPVRLAADLSDQEQAALLKAIRNVLRKGIRNLGTSLGHGQSNFKAPRGEAGRNAEQLHVYGQTGLPCTACGTQIEKIKVAGRGTHICPKCQKF